MTARNYSAKEIAQISTHLMRARDLLVTHSYSDRQFTHFSDILPIHTTIEDLAIFDHKFFDYFKLAYTDTPYSLCISTSSDGQNTIFKIVFAFSKYKIVFYYVF
jgi:hypothetical protein